jgi:hypothetical protein
MHVFKQFLQSDQIPGCFRGIGGDHWVGDLIQRCLLYEREKEEEKRDAKQDDHLPQQNHREGEFSVLRAPIRLRGSAVHQGDEGVGFGFIARENLVLDVFGFTHFRPPE